MRVDRASHLVAAHCQILVLLDGIRVSGLGGPPSAQGPGLWPADACNEQDWEGGVERCGE